MENGAKKENSDGACFVGFVYTRLIPDDRYVTCAAWGKKYITVSNICNSELIKYAMIKF